MDRCEYLKDTQVCKRLGVSRPTIWNWVAAGNFPKPVKLSERATRWRLSDLEKWEADRSSVWTAPTDSEKEQP